MLKVRKIPKKQIDNPKELHPSNGGVLRVTPDNAPMASVMLLTQIRDALVRIEKKLNG
jgi:hypothetical protein